MRVHDSAGKICYSIAHIIYVCITYKICYSIRYIIYIYITHVHDSTSRICILIHILFIYLLHIHMIRLQYWNLLVVWVGLFSQRAMEKRQENIVPGLFSQRLETRYLKTRGRRQSYVILLQILFIYVVHILFIMYERYIYIIYVTYIIITYLIHMCMNITCIIYICMNNMYVKIYVYVLFVCDDDIYISFIHI